MSSTQERVIIVGAGPVGLVAAACLGKAGIETTVIELHHDLPKDLRASTFHPPTLDLLDRFGVTPRLIERGLIAPHWQFRDRREGVIATFDLSMLEGETTPIACSASSGSFPKRCEPSWRLIRLSISSARRKRSV